MILPDNIPVADVKLEAYTGPQGGKGRDFTATIDNGAPLFATTRVLNAREGLTIVAMWPKGYITVPVEESVPAATGPTSSDGYNYAQDAGDSSHAGRSPIEGFLGRDLPKNNLLAFLGLFRTGRAPLLPHLVEGRPRPAVASPSRVRIAKGQSPASMRYLNRMGYDNDCFAAAVLAGRERPSAYSAGRGILGIGRKSTLRKQATPDINHYPPTKSSCSSIVAEGSSLVLEQESRARGEARTNHRPSPRSVTPGLLQYQRRLALPRHRVEHPAGVACVALPGNTYQWPHWHFTTPAGWFTLLTVLLMLVANGVFGKLLQAPTVAGQALMDHIRGFKMYLEVAEGEELKRVKAPPPPLTPQLFESYLPAALALGVEQRWAERFADVLNVQAPNYAPAWYAGPGWNIRDVGSFLEPRLS